MQMFLGGFVCIPRWIGNRNCLNNGDSNVGKHNINLEIKLQRYFEIFLTIKYADWIKIKIKQALFTVPLPATAVNVPADVPGTWSEYTGNY